MKIHEHISQDTITLHYLLHTMCDRSSLYCDISSTVHYHQTKSENAAIVLFVHLFIYLFVSRITQKVVNGLG